MSNSTRSLSFPIPVFMSGAKAPTLCSNLLRPRRETNRRGHIRVRFRARGDRRRFMLSITKTTNRPIRNNAHQRILPRKAMAHSWSPVWFMQAPAACSTRDPDTVSIPALRFTDLESATGEQIYLWNPAVEKGRRVNSVFDDHLGPVFEMQFTGKDIHHGFVSRFHPQNDANGSFELFEPDFANRALVCSRRRRDLGASGETAEFATVEPQKKTALTYRQEFDSPAKMLYPSARKLGFRTSTRMAVPRRARCTCFEAEITRTSATQ